MKKKLLSEAQVRRFMGLAGLNPLNEMAYKHDDEKEMREGEELDEMRGAMKKDDEMREQEGEEVEAEPQGNHFAFALLGPAGSGKTFVGLNLLLGVMTADRVPGSAALLDEDVNRTAWAAAAGCGCRSATRWPSGGFAPDERACPQEARRGLAGSGRWPPSSRWRRRWGRSPTVRGERSTWRSIRPQTEHSTRNRSLTGTSRAVTVRSSRSSNSLHVASRPLFKTDIQEPMRRSVSLPKAPRYPTSSRRSGRTRCSSPRPRTR